MIKTFNDRNLENAWVSGDFSYYSNSYRAELEDILVDIHQVVYETDIQNLPYNVVNIDPEWNITVSLNGFETAGNVKFQFDSGHAYEVSFEIFN